MFWSQISGLCNLPSAQLWGMHFTRPALVSSSANARKVMLLEPGLFIALVSAC